MQHPRSTQSTYTSDTGSGSDSEGDLLYAISQANANTNPAGSEIEFDPTVFALTADDHPEQHSGDFRISRAGGDRRSGGEPRDGQRQQRRRGVLGGSGVTASLTGLTISSGLASQGGGIFNGGSGGDYRQHSLRKRGLLRVAAASTTTAR